MRKYPIYIFLVYLTSVSVSCAQEIIVGVFHNPPHMLVKDGKPDGGVFIDLLDYIADQNGIDLKYKVGTPDECYDWLDTGGIDMLAESGISELHMAKYVMCEETVVSIWAQVYVSSSTNLTSIFELDGKKVAFKKESYFLTGPNYGMRKLAKDLDIQPEIVEVESEEEVLRLISEGQVQAGVINRAYGELNAHNYNVQVTPIVFSPFRLTYAFSKKSEQRLQLKTLIDDNIKRLKADRKSIYYSVIGKYFLVNPKDSFPMWGWIIIGAVLIMVAQLLSYILLLRKQVSKRTKGLKEALAEIKEREYLLSTIYNNSVEFMALIQVTDDNDILVMKLPDWFLEQMYLENPEYPPHKILGMRWWDIYNEVWKNKYDNLQERYDRLMSVVQSGEILNYEEYNNPSGGELLTFESTLVPIKKSGKVKYILYVTRNVSEQRAATEVLIKSEETLRLAIENIPVMINAFDDKGNLMVWNKKSEEVTGYRAEEVIGNPKALSMLYPDLYLQRLSDKWEKGEFDYDEETEIRCKNGETKTISWRHEAKTNPVPGWYDWGVGIDITDRRRAETALVSSEKRLSNLIFNFPGTVYRIDPKDDFSFTFISNGSKEIFNLTPMQFRENDLTPLDFVEDQYKTASRKVYQEVVDSMEFKEQITAIVVGDEEKWLLERFRAVEDEDGQTVIDGLYIDITERIRTEVELVKNRQQTQALLDNIPGMAYRLSTEQGFPLVFSSEGSYELLGITAKDAMAMKIEPKQFLSPEENARVHEKAKEALLYNKLVEMVIPINVSGKVKWVLDRFKPIKVEGKWFIDGLLIDISDKIENEQRLQMALEGAREGLWEYDVLTNEMIFNDHLKTILGLDIDHLKSLEDFLELLHPEHKNSKLLTMADHLTGESEFYEEEYQLMTGSGEYKWIHARGKVIERHLDGSPLRWIGTYMDIDDRKIPELTLAQNEKRLRVLMSNLPGMVYKCHNDKDWTMEFVSDGAEALTGYNPIDFTSNQVKFGKLIDKIDRHRVWTEVQNALKKDESFTVVYRIRTIDDQMKWIWERGSGMDDGMIEGFMTDITDRVEAEERIITTMLETEDKERKRIAKELHDSLGQKLTTASLNFNALRNVVRKDEQIIKKLQTGLKHLNSAIVDSRDIAHNLMPQSIEDFGYVLSVESMVADIELASDINFQLFNNLKGERIASNLEVHLYRVTQEAINNILKYAEAQNVTIQLMKLDDELLLTIEDDGKGFEIGEKINGDGMGLKSMRNRINSIGGEFNIDSSSGNGSIITIEIPLKIKDNEHTHFNS